jgi:hypothetical protein
MADGTSRKPKANRSRSVAVHGAWCGRCIIDVETTAIPSSVNAGEKEEETTMHLPKSRGRVIRHSPASANLRIEHNLGKTIAHYRYASPADIDRRLRELDSEWDIERMLETNASIICLAGLALGAGVDRRFFMLPAVVAGFLQHALQGWCPPVGIFRRMGVRTTEEIEAERYALKYMRGDFGGPGPRQASAASIAEAVAPVT